VFVIELWHEMLMIHLWYVNSYRFSRICHLSLPRALLKHRRDISREWFDYKLPNKAK